MTRRPRVLVVGSTMMDLITYTGTIPGPGETVTGETFELGFGGKGANQAVVAHLVGAQVAFVNRVGGDRFGELTLEHLTDVGLDTSHVVVDQDRATGAATILVEPSGENRIVIAPGANARVTPDDVDRALAAIGPPDVVLCQLEINQAAVRHAMRRGRELGATTVLNPAPAPTGPLDWIEDVDWLIPNETELARLTDGDDSPAAADELAARTGGGVVITLGADGAMVVQRGGRRDMVEAPAVEAVDTTGAGDAFAAVFSVALASGLSPTEAADDACAAAAESVTRRGTQRAYLDSTTLPELGRSFDRLSPPARTE